MFKVVLVDDEPLVIEGLQAMISWEELGFKICGIAYDGEAAYELIKESNPDLVITDVRMPGMDGLVLMKKCQSLSALSARFIILSGYSDFNYVKEAIGLKGMSYVLKPIDPDEIEPILKRFVQERNEIEVETQRKLAQIDFILRTSLVRILRGETKDSLFQRVQFILGLTEGSFLRIVRVEKGSVAGNLMYQEDEGCKILYVDTILGRDVYLIYGEHKSQQEIKEIFLSWKELIDIAPKLALRVYCSYEIENLRDLPKAYSDLEQGKTEAFYSNDFFVLLEDTKEINEKKVNCHEADCIYELFQPSVIERFYEMEIQEDRNKEITLWLQKIRSKRVDKDKLFHYYGVMIEVFLHEKGIHQELTSLQEFPCFQEWKLHVVRDLDVLCQRSQKEPELIDRVKSYLDLHYQKDIKLKSVAKEFGFNTIYFGQWFLKATGMKYNDYILVLRIEKAKELLRYTGMQIKEIAGEIGFSNPDYFVLKFKDQEGMSPIQYRNRGGEKEQ